MKNRRERVPERSMVERLFRISLVKKSIRKTSDEELIISIGYSSILSIYFVGSLYGLNRYLYR